eukprot:2534591-Prorocentrum_lima.AAC.1
MLEELLAAKEIRVLNGRVGRDDLHDAQGELDVHRHDARMMRREGAYHFHPTSRQRRQRGGRSTET